MVIYKNRFLKLLLILPLISLMGCQRDPGPQNKTDNPPAPAVPRLDRGTAPAASYADVVERVAPSVVTIRSASRSRAPRQFPFFKDPRLGDLFGRMFGEPPAQGGRVRLGLGSGVVVRPRWLHPNEPSRGRWRG